MSNKRMSRRELLQAVWQDVREELEDRHIQHQQDWELFDIPPTGYRAWGPIVRRERVKNAYTTARAVENGMPVKHLSEEAILATAHTASSMAQQAHELVGDTELTRYLQADRSNSILSQLNTKDLPPEEIEVLGALGVRSSKEELAEAFRRTRIRAQTPQVWRRDGDVSESNVFNQARTLLDEEFFSETHETSELKLTFPARLRRRYFKGIRKVILGSALVVGDLGLAFGWPPGMFPEPNHGWGTLTSIIGGIDLGMDGVGDLLHGDRTGR